jgi:hypothetical protein
VDGDEVLCEVAAVFVQQLIDSLKPWRANDQAGVVALLYAVNDLFINISGGVGIFLFRE